MKLIGSCKRCQHCCKYMQFIMPNGKTVKEWGLARGFEIVQESESFIEFKIKSVCPHLKDRECDIHDHKPDVCRRYPEGMPEFWLSHGLDPNKSLGKHCGYKWVS